MDQNCSESSRKADKNRTSSEKINYRYLTAGHGIYLDFVLDGESAILFFKTAGFDLFATIPLSAF